MTELFMNKLKDFMMSQIGNEVDGLSGYFETINQNIGILSQIIEDSEGLDYDFSYEIPRDDEERRYNPCNILIHIYDGEISNDIGHYYKIEFGFQDRPWGYCDCSVNDEDYNHFKNCCGASCDWEAPEIRMYKIRQIGRAVFEGLNRDLWRLNDEWTQEEREKKSKRTD